MNLTKFKEKDNKFYYYYYLIITLIHLILPIRWADDAIFIEKASTEPWRVFIDGSARPLVDSLTFLFAKYPLLWRVLNPLMLITLSVLISKYFLKSCNKKVVAFVSFAILFPAMVIVDAGFIATTLNYLWPVTLGLLCLLPLWKTINNQKTSIYEMILLIPCLLYATNMQQMSVVLVVLLLFGSIYCLVKKKKQFYVFIQLVIAVFCALYSFYINTTGDNSRMLRETERYFPDFINLNLFEKFELGFSSTFYCLTMQVHFAWVGFTAFALFLAVIVFKKSDKLINRIQACFPLLCSFYGLVRTIFSEKLFFIEKYVPGAVKNTVMKNASYSFEIVADLVYLAVVLCILYSLWIIMKDRIKFVGSAIIFLFGLGTRMIMGFSPTVWASGFRTFFIMLISFIIITAIIINENKEVVLKKEKILQTM